MNSGLLGKLTSVIERINQARIEVESFFSCLPHTHASLIKSLIGFANPSTGCVENITYQSLIDILNVAKAPGRANTVIQKQTIRSYLRTIEKFCSEHFQVVSEGQQLIIQFSTLPSIYAKYLKNTDLYTEERVDLYTLKSLDNTAQKKDLDDVINTEEYIEVYTDRYTQDSSVKKNNIFNINKKQQQHTTHTKLPISDDFYPTEETISTALAQGFISATCPLQISKFIAYNKARGSLWADYNPIFLKWLEQDSKRKTNAHLLIGESHERYTNKRSKSKPTLEDVINANRDAVSPNGARYNAVVGCFVADEIPRLALDTNVTNLRTVIY